MKRRNAKVVRKGLKNNSDNDNEQLMMVEASTLEIQDH